MTDTQKELAMYEGQLVDLNRQISALDEQRAALIRKGVRIEGIVQYLQAKERERLADPVKAPEATDVGAAQS